jgi:hypothetical protein
VSRADRSSRKFYRVASDLTALPGSGDPKKSKNRARTSSPIDHRSFRAQLVFGFAVSRSRDLLRRILKDHASDDARQQVTERVIRVSQPD